jgi:hypothetical protein
VLFYEEKTEKLKNEIEAIEKDKIKRLADKDGIIDEKKNKIKQLENDLD